MFGHMIDGAVAQHADEVAIVFHFEPRLSVHGREV
jgi:hypothetical protein